MVPIIFCLIGLSGIAGSVYAAITTQDPLILLVALFFSAFAGVGLKAMRDEAKFKKEQLRRAEQNYEWYKAQHPECTAGAVKCHHCSATKISVQRLMNRTFFRAHVCSTCGSTLYYSHE